MKKIIALLLITAIGTGGYMAYTMWSDHKTLKGLALVPDDAIYILESENPIANWRSFSKSNFWSFLKKHPSLAEVSSDADYLDDIINQNKAVFGLFGKRNFLMSAHVTKPKDYDFLFLIDLGKASKLKLLPLVLKTVINKNEYSIKEGDYEGINVFDLYDKKAKDHLYISQVNNYVVCSYTYKLVQKSIDQSKVKDYKSPELFTEAYSRTDQDGLARVYLNYSLLDDYIKQYADMSPSMLNSLSSSFSYTGLDMNLGDDDATFKGYTSLPKEGDLYSKLLQQYGNAEFGFDEVISARTAYLQAIGINKFKEFYKKVMELRSKESSSVAEYNELKNKVEKVLGLSIEKDLLAWIGNEIVLAQNNPSSLHRNEDDLLVAIKAYNMDFAKEKLTYIQKRIKRRTPAKFRKMTYKTHEIYYLDVKGFFGLFFGKAFSKLTKPYYTIIGDYIIFSNDPKTLVSAIEDYENGYVLANSPDFIRVKESMPSESVLFSYVSGPYVYPVLANKIAPAERSNYAKNEPYLSFFKGIGISYTARGDGFENTLYMHYKNVPKTTNPVSQSDELASEYLENNSEALQGLSEAETFVLNVVNDGEFIKYFKDGTTVHLRGDIKDGQFYGDFEEFYANGNLRSTGKYRKGRKVGRWKYYTETGELSEKEWEGIF
jgi:hypothetical protein